MKFSQYSAFEKHLEGDPAHLFDVYLFIDHEPYVQKQLAKKVLPQEIPIETYDLETLSLGKLREVLETSSLFTPKKSVLLQNTDKIPKALEEPLFKYMTNPDPRLRVALTGSKWTPYCQMVCKEIIALDLSLEKPWERETRLSEYLTKKLRREGVKISSALSDQMAKICASKFQQADQELEKLICYCKGQGEVKRQDLELLLKGQEYSTFKVAEALLEKRGAEALKMIHQMRFPPILLIYTFRSFFQKCLRQKELPTNRWHEVSPYLKGRLLEKSVRQLKDISLSGFKKALSILYEMEVQIKNQPIREEMVLSLLFLKLQGVHESFSV